ncbi:MAG: sodium:proline symporter, partial [Lentisphaeria bacterium]|nr:sodium:proline symporter [Lentisphaeria bacterium]
MIETYVTFACYLLFMIAVGVYFFFKSKDISDYLLGGRGVGSWVTALSAQASDMSGWLLMGLPGAIYLAGFGEAWVAVGLAAGTFLNWMIVAPRLRIYTEKTNSMTLAAFFSQRFRDPTGYMRVFSAIITLFFFTIYAASGLNATGNLFEEMFGISYTSSVIIGAAVLLIYTFLGGYLAVRWTDLFQGFLMFFALIAVPVIA